MKNKADDGLVLQRSSCSQREEQATPASANMWMTTGARGGKACIATEGPAKFLRSGSDHDDDI